MKREALTGGWAGFRSVLEDLDPTPSPPPSSQEDDASASDSDVDEEAAAWWRREHGDAAVDAPSRRPRNRPAAADRQDDALGGSIRRRRPSATATTAATIVKAEDALRRPRRLYQGARSGDQAGLQSLALRLHPDRRASPTANRRCVEVREAYATLGDRSTRAACDAQESVRPTFHRRFRLRLSARGVRRRLSVGARHRPPWLPVEARQHGAASDVALRLRERRVSRRWSRPPACLAARRRTQPRAEFPGSAPAAVRDGDVVHDRSPAA